VLFPCNQFQESLLSFLFLLFVFALPIIIIYIASEKVKWFSKNFSKNFSKKNFPAILSVLILVTTYIIAGEKI